MQAFHGLGDDVEVLGRVQRHRGAGLGAEFMRPHAGAVDHHVGADLAKLGAYADGGAVLNQDFLRRTVLKNARTAAFGALGQGLGGVNRVGAAIFGQVDAAHQVVNAHAGPKAGNLGRGQGLHLQPKALGHRGAALEFFKARQVGGHRDGAGLAKAGGLAGFLFQRGVQIGGVLRQTREVVGGAQLADQPGCMPGGAAGELLALEQNNIGAAPQGEVIRQTAADDAAAHNDNACPVR